MVKQGDLVRVNGKEAKVETVWGQGKHLVFKLNDGTQVLDLDKLVADGRATVLGTKSIPDSGIEIPMPLVNAPAPEKRPVVEGPEAPKKWLV